MTELSLFSSYLVSVGRSPLTAKAYAYEMTGFAEWFKFSTGTEWDGKALYRANCIDYKGYLVTIKNRQAVSVNKALSAFRSYTEFLQSCGYEQNEVIMRKDYVRIQSTGASLAKADEHDVRRFIQAVLEHESLRDYTLVVLLAMTGLRISEALNIRKEDCNITAREIIVRSGKKGKQRIAYMSDKLVNALTEYERQYQTTVYLFESRLGNKLDRTCVNRVFNRHSDVITPHQLRHYFCTQAIKPESGMSVNEVAALAGHTNIHTTLRYMNPTKDKLIQKLNNIQ